MNNFKEVLRQRQEIESRIEALKSSLKDASQSYDEMADQLETFNIPRET
jgi:acyl carrier protein phosphodiesterase